MEQKNLDRGRKGEVNVINTLISGGLDVKDYTNYEEFRAKQHKGYDIEVLNPSTQEWDRVDIKTNLRNEYIYLEDLNDYKDKLGWFWTSAADSIYHYDLEKDNLYGYELKKMRNHVFKSELTGSYGRNKNLIGLKVDETKIIKKII